MLDTRDASTWQDFVDACQHYSVDEVIDAVFWEVDQCLQDGEFDIVDEMLATVVPESIPSTILSAILTITYPAHPHLPERAKLLERAAPLMTARQIQRQTPGTFHDRFAHVTSTPDGN